MLIREDLASELAIVTRVLAHAGVLAREARITVLAGEVVYLAGRGVSNARMTPYDVIAVRLRDGHVLRGEADEDVDLYLAAHRATGAKSVALARDGTLVTGSSLRACAVATLSKETAGAVEADSDEADRLWRRAEVKARAAGALIGATA